FGWHHWPQYPWMSYQFRRALGETQEGGGAVSECFLAASRMIPGDKESWYREWKRIADQNLQRGNEERAKGHVQTAMNCWLRASEYYRQGELWILYACVERRMAVGCLSSVLSGPIRAALLPSPTGKPAAINSSPNSIPRARCSKFPMKMAKRSAPILFARLLIPAASQFSSAWAGLIPSKTKCGSCRRAERCNAAFRS